MTTIIDIERLCYLGMRLALRQSVAASELRAYSEICAKRRNQNLQYWIDNEDLPRVILEGLEKVQRGRDLGRGVVVTSFQIGPYNWLPMILNAQAHLPVTLLVDADNFMLEQRRWVSRESKYQGRLAEPVRYINSEEPTAVWKMARSLREQRALVGWFDGHTGVTETESSKSTLAVRFCETSMRVRMGLAYLSARTGAPLILAVARNVGDDGVAVRFEDPLSIRNNETVDRFCRRASEHLVSILEGEVRADPACWEEWCHFHSWNIFGHRSSPRAGLDGDVFLDVAWRFDSENVDILEMSEGDVLVSLNSGEALAATPLLVAICDALTGARTARDVVASLAGRFAHGDVCSALCVLCDAHFVLKVA